jgi:hypothetical protein
MELLGSSPAVRRLTDQLVNKIRLIIEQVTWSHQLKGQLSAAEHYFFRNVMKSYIHPVEGLERGQALKPKEVVFVFL